jgi:dipeptidyl aminopeptidase/acylaminoacyl peptidase
MKIKFFIPIFFFVAAAFAQSPPSTGKHPFTFEDMMKLKRLDGPAPSPDGKWVVFSATDVDLEANTRISHLWIVPASGGPAEAGRRLNETPNHEERPRFSPDGKRLIWTSKATDPSQIWMCDFNSGSGTLVGKPHQVTNISTGADGAIWSPDGKNIVFVSSVYPDCNPPPPGSGVTSDDCNKKRDDELKNNKVKAKIFTKLFYRHWNAFTEFKRSHLFVTGADANSSGSARVSRAASDVSSDANQNVLGGTPSAAAETAALPKESEPRDLTPGDHDVPPFHLGGQDMYAISPDGQELAYTSNIDEVEATSTNSEIFTVPLASSSANSQSGSDPKEISTSPGADSTPRYSPDGKYIAWRSQARAGFEADKWRLLVQDRQSGKTRELAKEIDRSVESLAWSKDSKHIFFVCDYNTDARIFATAREPDPNLPNPRLWAENTKMIGAGDHVDDLVVSADGQQIFYTDNSVRAPNEIWHQKIDVSPNDLLPGSDSVTHMNDALLSQIEMPKLDEFRFKGANNDYVYGFLLKPTGFDPNKKYPLKFLIHGGPQGAWGNSWTYRWNAELFAVGNSESFREHGGYVVVMINFHGSTGYGQKFTDSISGDWGGKPYIDLMKGLDYVEKTYPFIDKNREAALGASYGGYMANWLLGHTDRFKCIVSHDGMFNAESAYGTTEELWFNEWEFKGPPWKNRELYRKFSPHLFADKFKTPTLVIHSQNDYRLDVSQGFDLFTTLQRLKVPSKMLYFPDEGHWVLKPQNSRLWYKTVNDWVDQWCKK